MIGALEHRSRERSCWLEKWEALPCSRSSFVARENSLTKTVLTPTVAPSEELRSSSLRRRIVGPEDLRFSGE
ncbi:hypothetical protein [Haladaptatus halobius]|uniref:hypothetical protein n=1 Tax=Haladaptatus halobius TaxID=2884875 RepID=UPI001D0AE563|nr:hypothetical protein [Haladaptatus halobius]